MTDHSKAIEVAIERYKDIDLEPPTSGETSVQKHERALSEAITAYLAARAEGESPAKLCPREPSNEMLESAGVIEGYGGEDADEPKSPIMSNADRNHSKWWQAAWDAAPEPGHD